MIQLKYILGILYLSKRCVLSYLRVYNSSSFIKIRKMCLYIYLHSKHLKTYTMIILQQIKKYFNLN